MTELTPAAKAVTAGIGQSIGRGLEVMYASLMSVADPGGAHGRSQREAVRREADRMAKRATSRRW